MERSQREPFALEKERQLRQQDVRIAATEVRARELGASEPIEELDGVRALQASLKESVEHLKERDAADWETIRSDVEEALATLLAALSEIDARLDELEPSGEGARLDGARRRRAPSQL
jgi:hypothetical protein